MKINQQIELNNNFKYEALRDFIKKQLDDRDMSARQFADLIGVSHMTIARYAYPKTREIEGSTYYIDPGVPSVEFLMKLATATSTPLNTLIALTYPDAQQLLGISDFNAQANLFYQRFIEADEQARTIIESLLSIKNKKNKIKSR